MKGRLLLGVGISALFLWLALRNVEGAELVRSLREVRPLYLLVAFLFTVVIRFWLTALRWQVLLQPIKPIGAHRLFSVTMIGFMANNVLPARMGEFVRAYALGRTESLSKSLSFATIMIERVFDGLTLLGFLAVAVFFVPFPAWVAPAAEASLILYLAILGVMVWLWHRPETAARWLGRLLGRFPALQARALGILRSFTLGLEVLTRGHHLAAVLGLSILIWLGVVVGVQLAFRALGLSLPPIAGVVLVSIVSLGVMLPSSPGFVGTFQFFTVTSLALFGVPDSQGFSFSLVYHAMQYFPITAMGLAYLWWENLSLREVRTSEAAP